ncbi:hypothetical protein [Bradyrhizobium sp. HKCCYLS3013]|uniref:hypothetical protein n=1 Tax=Bradyrhizobium sp. HKCCYLS3013 TaxID=3420735 RepID=UPI003EBBDC03
MKPQGAKLKEPLPGLFSLDYFFPRFLGRRLQKLGSIDVQYLCQLSDYFQAYERPTLFQLAHIRSIHAGLIGQILLGQSFGVPKAAQVRSKDLAEVHASANQGTAY